jgi:hypothetical protein
MTVDQQLEKCACGQTRGAASLGRVAATDEEGVIGGSANGSMISAQSGWIEVRSKSHIKSEKTS